jgi:hypothetical protein
VSTVSQVGAAVTTSNTASLTPSVTGTWGTGQNRTAGNLLVAVVTAYGNNTAFLGDSPAGWMLFDGGHGALTNGTDLAFTYFRTATGADAAPTFTAVDTGTAADCRLDVTLYEYSDSGGGTPVLSTSGMAAGTSGATLTVTTRLAVPAGSAALAVIVVSQGTTAATAAWTPPAGWTAEPNITASFRAQSAIWSLASPGAGSTLSAALPKGRTTTTLQAGLIVVISPAGTAQPMYTDSLASKSQASVTAATGVTWTHVSNGTGALVVGISCGDPSVTGTGAISTITCDGTPLPAITVSEQPGTGGDSAGFVRQYGLAGVAGGSHTIVVKPNQTLDLELSSRVIAGADPSSPFGTGTVAQGNGATASLAKTGTAGNLLLYVTCSGTAIGGGPNGTAYRTYGKTLNGNSGGGAGDHGTAVATGSSQTISTLVGTDDWAISVVEILPPSASTVQGTASMAGQGSVTSAAVTAAPATAAGQGSVTAVSAGLAGATAAGQGQVTAAATQPGAGTITGQGQVGAPVATQLAVATAAGQGQVTSAEVQAATATAAGQGQVTAAPAGQAGASAAGQGSVSAPAAVQLAPAAAAGQGQVTAVTAVQAAASMAGQGSVAAPGTLAASALMAGLGQVTAAPASAAPATVTGQGSVAAPASTQLAPASMAGQGSVTAVTVQPAAATASGQGSVTADSAGSTSGTGTITGQGTVAPAATQLAPASMAGQGDVTAAATQRAAAAAAGQGTVTGTPASGAAASAAGQGSVAAPASTQLAPATITGLGSVTATPSGSVSGTGSMAGQGAVGAVAVQQAPATITGAGQVTAVPAVTAVTVTITGLGSVTATPSSAAAGTATAAGHGALAVVVVLAAGAVITGQGSVTAAGSVLAAVVPGTASAGVPAGPSAASGRAGQPAAAAGVSSAARAASAVQVLAGCAAGAGTPPTAAAGRPLPFR